MSSLLLGGYTYSQKTAVDTCKYPYQEIHHYQDIVCENTARQFLNSLGKKEKLLLYEQFAIEQQSKNTKVAEDNSSRPTDDSTHISHPMLKNVFLYNALPFVGFGFLDNFIMIVAGEYIDLTLGVSLGISTMAAAAIGNILSDVAGLGTAGYMEALVSKIGITHPVLTLKQSGQRQIRWTMLLGRIIGITFGCIIGMCPLLFFENKCSHPKEGKT